MNRFQFYEKKIASKLLLSKFVYQTTKNKISLQKTVLTLLPPSRDADIAAFGLAATSGRFPTFANAMTFDNKVLRRVFFTGTSIRAVQNLQILANKILPFQLENKIEYPALSKDGELNWLLLGCRAPNDIQYLFAKYPVSDNVFDLTVQLKFSRPLWKKEENFFHFEAIYYARLFQIPIDTFIALDLLEE